ncbi:uncharacterized protein PAC_19406 [Phialocephala subalpina]|uniref:FAD-binding domain-containing protein n=1 Tax=Phialocephala subalpina TaxID=576137 RepID=A0A1L7XWU6_9HELO|nr:uncharacterized protein PAC_19406 [Phialocephala subalpina]
MNEEYFDIVICGCGPTGASLSANLSRLGIRHLVLEREDSITSDPRGIALDEDGIRIVQGVGKYEQLFTDVGKAMGMFRFIDGGRGLHVNPFLQIDNNTIAGGTGHVGFMSHKQPQLEKHSRDAMDKKYGELRGGATMTKVSEDDENVHVTYQIADAKMHRIRAKFLVGADGKTGFVRKNYLEAKGVLMEKSLKFQYEAVWVALNWYLALPTPKTHPEFPPWNLGYSPEEVYGLFFPRDFDFVSSRPLRINDLVRMVSGPFS